LIEVIPILNLVETLQPSNTNEYLSILPIRFF